MPKPTDEDIQLFREAVKEIKPLEKNDKVVFRKKPSKARLKKPLLNSTEEFGFSDHIRETVSAEQTLFFHRSGLQYKVLRALRQGNITPTAKLDLHDNTIDQARDKLDKFLQYCLQTQQRCV